MSERNTLVRSLHDIGAAAWFGGALMGAIGLNGAAGDIDDPRDRARVSADGWARWAPVNAVAIGVHGLGGLGLLAANGRRLRHQRAAMGSAVVKTVVTGAALAATAYSGLLGRKVAAAGRVPSTGAVVPSNSTPTDVAEAQRRLRRLQWVTPALTGAIVVLGTVQGELERPGQVTRGVLRGKLRR